MVSHGDLAKAYVDSAAMLVGDPEQLQTAGVYPDDTPEAFYLRVEGCVKETDTGEGVVALVDLFGGTPNNVVARLSRVYNIKIVTGANLPMVMYAICERTEEMTQQELVDGLLATGLEGIAEFSMNI